MSKLVALSDLHIWGSDDPLYRSLLNWMRTHAGPGNVIVLCGDVFDVFVGKKRLYLKRYGEFLETAREIAALGTDLHYIEGNHDFLLTRVLADIPRARVHSREFDLSFGGKRFYVAHGDLVDPHDRSYRFLRAVFRSPLNRAFVKAIPGEWVDWIGTRSSRYSRGSRPSLPSRMPNDRLDALRSVYRNFAVDRIGRGYDFVILGHCHDDDEMRFQIGDRKGQYANVGFPREHRTFLAFDSGDDEIRREPLR